MAVPSTMRELGTEATEFTLPDPYGNLVSLSDFDDAGALLVVFMCNHCPYVINIQHVLASFAREMMPKGLAMVGINSNDVDRYPEDSPERMKDEVERVGYPFPYLFDESQEIARAYDAACTPDFFLYDKDRRLVYRGQFDDSRPRNGIEPSGADLRAAVEAALEGRPVPEKQIPSIGCNIKWKPGNEPVPTLPQSVN
ncbi:MAG TPA: thioredoxin family protein [Rhodothermales bacterium]|nr:thioredoxin family protein [Rhodothermales bacterium]